MKPKNLLLNFYIATILMLTVTSINAQTLNWIGTLPGGVHSEAHGISNDGSVVVGWGFNNLGQSFAFRKEAGLQIQNLGTLGSQMSRAFAVSGDGSVVIGYSMDSIGYEKAFRWTETTGIQDLGTLGGSDSEARGISADGSVIVGTAYNSNNFIRAFRWENEQMQDLGAFGSGNSNAYAVTQDGNIIVGRANYDSWEFKAFKWVNGTMQDLGTLGGVQSVAYCVSDDGNVIAGNSNDSSGWLRAFRWTSGGGMQDLGDLGGIFSSSAFGMSADGNIIVGESRNSSGLPLAFRWTSNGIEDLNVAYSNLLVNNSILRTANAITPDGRFIVGAGYNGSTGRDEGFILDTQPATSIENENSFSMPQNFALEQNYPNPFNPSTKIAFVIPNGERNLVTLKVYDVLGNEVATLVNEYREAGRHSVTFDASSAAGGLASGMYLYRLQLGNYSETKKMILMK